MKTISIEPNWEGVLAFMNNVLYDALASYLDPKADVNEWLKSRDEARDYIEAKKRGETQ